MSDSKGRYRIHAVSEMTGVPSATLRAWERRYGLPVPDRTASSYRLYSDADIAMVQRVRDLCAQGMAPAEAARLVLAAQAEPHRPQITDDVYATFCERILAAVMAFDARTLESEARASLMVGSAGPIFEQVIVPVMREVGVRWHAGELSIAQEHMASEVLGNLARDLLRLVQPGNGARVALLACFPDETHALPLYVVGFYLAQLGYRAVVLGARTPIEEIGRVVGELDPAVVALSCTLSLSVEQMERVLEGYGAACGSAPFVVGGLGAAEHHVRIAKAGGVIGPTELSSLGSLLGRYIHA